jgi:hypothetical protein
MTKAPCFKISTTLAFGLEMLMNLSFYLCAESKQHSKQCSCKTQSTKPEAKRRGNGSFHPIFIPSSADSLLYLTPSNGYNLTVSPLAFHEH